MTTQNAKQTSAKLDIIVVGNKNGSSRAFINEQNEMEVAFDKGVGSGYINALTMVTNTLEGLAVAGITDARIFTLSNVEAAVGRLDKCLIEAKGDVGIALAAFADGKSSGEPMSDEEFEIWKVFVDSREKVEVRGGYNKKTLERWQEEIAGKHFLNSREAFKNNMIQLTVAAWDELPAAVAAPVEYKRATTATAAF